MSFSYIVCKIFRHKQGKRTSVHKFLDGRVSWITVCPRCGSKLICLQGDVKSNKDYITTAEITR